MEDRKDYVSKGMLIGAAIGIVAGISIGAMIGGKEKILMLGAIGLLSGAGMGYGGKKFIMS